MTNIYVTLNNRKNVNFCLSSAPTSFVRVFSDNYRNINLIERCGALTVNSIPMKKIVENGHPKWVELKSEKDEDISKRYLNIMEIKKENFKID